MKKIFKVIIDVEEDDFCECDLEHGIVDGAENIGNHTINEVEVQRFEKLPFRLDSFEKNDSGFYIEYDGFHFEAKSEKACFNQILKYIFTR